MSKNIAAIFLTLAIPFILFLAVWQSSRYTTIENEISRMDKQQHEIVLHNKRLISAITVLSIPERIEKVAIEDLNMRKAHSSEIMRISLKKGELGG